MLKSFTIDDDLTIQDTAAVEVSLDLADGRRRWCFFMTPAALAACGDTVPGTSVHYHYGASHMIVVAAPLDRALIESVLRDLDQRGELPKCSMVIDEALE